MLSRSYEDYHNLMRNMIVAKTDLNEDSATRILATLRKFGAVDVVMEFADTVELTDNRTYNAGYLDALDDLMRFIKHGPKEGTK